ncbi:hypothetical protein AMTR_s00109p00116080 [Amborella trichopoda]|uniref:Uncharacterized protein n=1 Tax=Amborella trichopoda TaxID=13333 RepID=W1NTY6_AMBTC|nr:hypothetical protein AMTR_s00109p00116080 [Amborella trichopoda]
MQLLEYLRSRSQKKEDTQKSDNHLDREKESWIEGMKSSRGPISVVASLIATGTFTMGLSPPGG